MPVLGRDICMSDLSKVLHDLDRLMASTQQEAAHASRSSAEATTDAESSGLAGKIRVKLDQDGRVRELLLADEVMSMQAAELARELTSVINAAWGKMRSTDPAAGAAAATDMAALADRLGVLREESVRSMGEITTALTDALTKINRRLS